MSIKLDGLTLFTVPLLLEPQEELLEQICISPIITVDELLAAGVLDKAGTRASRTTSTENPDQIPIDFSEGDNLQT